MNGPRQAAALVLVGCAALWASSRTGGIRFEEIGSRAGVRTLHHTRKFAGPYADALEMFTSGGAAAAVADYDNDGDLDIFVTDSGEGQPHRLFRNKGDGTFDDVAHQAGVSGGNTPDAICSDALWFDFDNDGFEDLLVARFGTSLLYRNLGNGKFRNVSAASGLSEFGNTIAAVAFDYDGDGWLDVMLGDYFPPVNLFALKTTRVLPDNLDDAHNGGGVRLYRNNRGKFVNVTRKAGLAAHDGWTLDIGHGDLDNDGDQDFYLACDYGTDRIFFNNGDGTFRDATKSAMGHDTKKGMNAEIADFNNDGWLDIYVTNITDDYMKECNMLWRNSGDGTFIDVSKETATCDTLWGWGAKFADFDNDGRLDLFVTNGLRSAGAEEYIPKVFEMIIRPGVDFSDLASWPKIGKMSWSGYQKGKLFHNLDGESFTEIAAAAGVANDLDGRGVALGDFDNDGRVDVYQTNANQPSLLYRNTTAGGNWVVVELRDPTGNRFGVGGRVRITAGGQQQIREIDGGNGYASQSGKRAYFGLGAAAKIDSAQVRWPDGAVQAVTLQSNRLNVVKKLLGNRPGDVNLRK